MLLRHKRFSALAIISLGVGIALNTTMYSVLDNMISPRLAMREPGRLYGFVFYGDFRGMIPAAEKFEAYRGLTFYEGLTGRGRTQYADGFAQRGSALREARTSTVLPNYFQVLGVKASMGRLLTANDMDTPGRPVVVSERFWNQLFSDKAGFETSTFTNGAGEVRTVVGVLPYEADFPGAGTDVWQLPVPADLANIPPMIARLKPGVTPEIALMQLDVVRKRFAEKTGEHNPSDAGFRLISATERPFKAWGFHYALAGSVIAVLLIACANLANLQLARGISRSRELATRAAVGATRRDIVAQLLTESAWLAFGGLLLGAVLTAWGMKLVDAYVPPTVAEYMTHTQLSWRVVVFAAAVTVVSLVLMGLLPAIQVSRVDISELLKSGAGTGKSRSKRRQYGALVIGEVALALALLCSASLLMKSAMEVLTFEPGFEERGLLNTYIATGARNAADQRTVGVWRDDLVSAALTIKGVTHAAVSTGRSPRTHALSQDETAGRVTEHTLLRQWGYTEVTPDYFKTMKIPITKGRDFTVGESVPSVIVDEPTASYLWPGVDPIGRMIKLDSAYTSTPWLKVIGVARQIQPWFRVNAIDRAAARARGIGRVYVLAGPDTARVPVSTPSRRYPVAFNLAVRTTDDPMKASVDLRQAFMDKGAGFVGAPRPGEATTGIVYFKAKHVFMGTLFAVFATLALALAALGVYAIIAHMVAQRTREFGVRLAVGAGANDIRQLVLKEGNVLALAGIAGGLLMTAYSAKWVRAFVFDDYDRYDSRVFAVASLVLFLTAWLASYIPARRAMRIDPVEALRND